jgi:hypothetical protein
MIAIRGFCKYGILFYNVRLCTWRDKSSNINKTDIFKCGAFLALYLPSNYTYAPAHFSGSASAHLARGDRLSCQDVYSGGCFATPDLSPTGGSKARFEPRTLVIRRTDAIEYVGQDERGEVSTTL